MGLYHNPRSGRWGIDLRVPPTRTGRRIRFPVGTKAEAQVVLAQKMVDARQQRFPILKPSAAPVTFDEASRRFLAEHAAQRRDPRSFPGGLRSRRGAEGTEGGAREPMIEGANNPRLRLH